MFTPRPPTFLYVEYWTEGSMSKYITYKKGKHKNIRVSNNMNVSVPLWSLRTPGRNVTDTVRTFLLDQLLCK